MSTTKQLSVGIIGGSGYTGGELIRILVNHPKATIDFVYSTTRANTLISDTHQDLLGSTDLSFTDTINPDVNVLFLCLGHGNSGTFLSENQFNDNTKIIDLSNDFRLKADRNFIGKSFVYGLPETNKNAIQSAQAIANPGCFATAIQLALLPLAASKQLNNEVHINAITGSTGAGVKPSSTTHFSWRNNNISWYKPFQHQHLGEINETLSDLQGSSNQLMFLPIRGDFTRGIYATAYTAFEGTLEEAYKLYEETYKNDPFTQVSKKEIHLKQVVNTNQCFIHLHKHDGYLLVTSIIDNLIKGASGQAIQNMNLMFGFDETCGLQLKNSSF
ncbi:MAG: N-acetyl-gamma-glutamyl-phosphate reductase [Flavobacteriaceae bacterium]|nr:N-acetyl-gamma-glutamyl-phosphate reductase [Flavobacteriaceae bacterium]MDG2315177.1 N-acetyl-gamma-glutamyl-phosphate reductase [Flavobacteriaceae bacterium]